MKNLKLVGLLLLLPFADFAQNVARQVVEYKPAPGQHINIEQTGTPQAAEKMPQSENNLVSLGGFGGYIVLKFNEPCVNDPRNPYGIDLNIFGNAFSGSSEPGVVWVMKDENKNAIPDDIWYEIAGSHYFHPKTIKNYQITYFKTQTRDVKWRDNYGQAGVLKANSYNTQEYYPTVANFPDYPQDSVVFTGTKLDAEIDRSNPVELKIKPLDFGYADNHPKKQGANLAVPDNPYTSDIEGAGGDPIDISWAVDSLGNYAGLNAIDFVKIETGYFADLGRLGEASADISYVVDVEPNDAVSGKETLLVVYHSPVKLLVGDTLELEANYFINGRIAESIIHFNSANPEIANFNGEGKLFALKTGSTEIEVSALNEVKTFAVEIVEPDSIAIRSDVSLVYPGDTILLHAEVFDNTGERLDLHPVFSVQNAAIGKLISMDNQTYFVASGEGETTIDCALQKFELVKSFPVKVHSPSDKTSIFFTAKSEEENLIPLQQIEVGLSDLNRFVENRQKDYSSLNRPVLAHAIAAGLQYAGVNFVFRDDEISGGKLYLYSIEKEGLFYYGWGGKTDPQPFARAWIMRFNNQQFLNGFDEQKIDRGDTLILYHVSDISTPWQLTKLTANKDSVKPGEVVELQLVQTTCSFQNDSVVESGFAVVSNAGILGSQTYFTDENGKVEVVLKDDPPWIFSAENDAVLISAKVVTGSDFIPRSGFRIFPNPVGDQLGISGKNLAGSKIFIVNLSGQVLMEKTADSNRILLNINELPAGFYQVLVNGNKIGRSFKIIKK